MRKSIRQIKDEVRGERILTDIRKITTFHRIQASPGYRAAAHEVLNMLQKEGIDSRILSYPFDEKTWYLSHKSFLEWDCKDAWLGLESPVKKRLTDFQGCSISIIQKSQPIDCSKEPIEIVLLDQGPKEEANESLDLEGKLIFIREDFKPYMDWAVKKRGALGFISDYMREVPGARSRADLYDARNYSSFWWTDTEKEPKTFGFVLTPREGDELAALCKKMAEEHNKDKEKAARPTATFKIDSSLYPGAIEVVEAVLPGEKNEEILLVSHLCHPRPSANDNASGVGAVLEALRVLKRLMEDKRLKALQRSIRVIFVPEFAGTYAWLADGKNQNKKVLAGLNLDMVGGRQTKGYGPLTISGQPHAAPTLVTDMAMLCFDEIKNSAPSLSSSSTVPMFNYFQGDFSAGSDHQVLSDPTINIPSPMLGQWPDKHYHTSADTVECLDPEILHKTASLAASYAYALANLEERDVLPLLTKSQERAIKELSLLLARALDEELPAEKTWEEMEHLVRFFQGTFRDLIRFFDREPYKEKLEGMTESFCKTIEEQRNLLFDLYLNERGEEDFVYATPEVPPKYSYIPRRITKSPIFSMADFLPGEDMKTEYEAFLEKHSAEYFLAQTLQLLVQYYIDGQRTLFAIANEVMIEAGAGSLEFVHDLVQLLVKIGTVEVLKD